MYLKKFQKAITETTKRNLTLPKEIYFEPNKRYLSPIHLKQLQQLLQISNIRPEDLHAQCFRFHLEIKQHLELLLNTKIYYTIGYINIYNNNYFKFNYETIDDLLVNKVKSNVKAHAWLTLPSLEIIDFTFPTTYLIQSKSFNGEVRVLANHADSLTKGLNYNPMLVGEDFLIKSGAINS